MKAKKMMSQWIAIVAIMVGVLGVINVQARDGKREKKEFSKDDFLKKRNDFLIRELSLTSAEAESFLKLSKELTEKKFELHREAREKAKNLRSKASATDADYEAVIDTWVNNRVKEANLEKEYYNKFKRVLPMQKVRKLQEVDMKFIRNVMDKKRDK